MLLQTPKEPVHRHAGDAVEQPLADARDHPADFRIRLDLNGRPDALGNERDQRISFDEPRTARALDEKAIRAGRILILQRDRALEVPGDRRNRY